jgi:hypothetical protein
MGIRLTNDQLMAAVAKTGQKLEPERHSKFKKRGKYNASSEYVDGYWFQSKAEAARYRQLLVMWNAGEIRHFHRQVSFDLGGGTKYSVDFMVIAHDDSIIYEDVKGALTKETKRNLKQVRSRYGVEVHLLKYDYRRDTFKLMEPV